MPLFDDILSTVGQQATNAHILAGVENTKANTALQLLQGQLVQQNMQISAAQRAALLADAQGTSGPAALTTAPTTGGAATSDDAPPAPFQEEYNAVRSNMMQSQRLLNIAKQAGNLTDVAKYSDDVREASNNLATVGEKQYKAQQDLLEQKSNLLASVHDQDSLNNALSIVKSNYGTAAAKNLAAQLNDPVAGVPVWNDATQAKLGQMSKQFTKAHEQVSDQIAALQFQRQVAKDAQEATNQQTQRAQEDQKIGLERDSIAQRERDRQTQISIRQGEHNDLQAQRVQSDARPIQTAYTAETKDFDTKRNSYQTAAEYLRNPDGTPKSTSTFTPTGDQALTNAYISMIHSDYKGSLYQLKSVDQLAGVPARIWQGIKNVAGGKELPGDVRNEMFHTMTAQMNVANSTQQQKEAQYLDQIKQIPGMNPANADVWIRKKSIGSTNAAASTPATGGTLPPKAQLVVGQSYPLPNGKTGNWNGTGFVLQ